MRQMKTSHHTKNKGDLGVLKAQLDLFEQGFMICMPLTEHAPFDLVAYRNGEFRRVQVKYRSLQKNGVMEVRFSTCWSDRNGTHIVPIDKNEVDLYCIYCPETDECYYIEPNKFRTNVSLRVKTSKNGQARGVNFAADFRRAP